MRRAAIYARYSTDLQSERSIDDQVALCRGHAAREGLTVEEIYADRALTSASIIGRDGLLRLMEDARAGRFDVLVVEALDRISRDQADLAGVFKRLRFAQIDIVAVHDGRADAIQIGLRGLMGELFLTDLKHKVRRGLDGVVRDGRSPGGRAYGYRPVAGAPGELAIEEEEAAVVRRIFGEYLDGRTPREICGRLNDEGVAPPRGARWNASTINGNASRGYGILRNPLYRGEIVWNRVTMVRDPDTGRRVSRTNPEGEWRRAEAAHLAIVDAETWSAAQDRQRDRSANARGGRGRAPRRVFSGLLRCGCCGGGMSLHDRAGSRVRVRCSTWKESRSCDNSRRYRIDVIERAVIGRLQEQLADPAYLDAYLTTYREERMAATRSAARGLAETERNLSRVAARLDRLTDSLLDGVVDRADYAARAPALREEKRALEARLAEARAAAPVVELHPGAIDNFRRTIASLAAVLADQDKAPDREVVEAIRAIIARVTLSPGDGNAAIVDVDVWLSALTGAPVEGVGGTLVAEGRSGRAPQAFALRIAI